MVTARARADWHVYARQLEAAVRPFARAEMWEAEATDDAPERYRWRGTGVPWVAPAALLDAGAAADAADPSTPPASTPPALTDAHREAFLRVEAAWIEAYDADWYSRPLHPRELGLVLEVARMALARGAARPEVRAGEDVVRDEQAARLFPDDPEGREGFRRGWDAHAGWEAAPSHGPYWDGWNAHLARTGGKACNLSCFDAGWQARDAAGVERA